uniref:Uncharacterized protein n=1 Tax=Kalanchoe fedtschenkoi TaxID=63787 RepID=A0A7N0VBX9_KALFE
MAMASSPALITPTTSTHRHPKLTTLSIKSKLTPPPPSSSPNSQPTLRRRDLVASTAVFSSALLLHANPASAGSDDEYVKETEEVINKVRSTITLDKNDPHVAEKVAELRDASNNWVAKYRREKQLLGRPSFRDIYSALNAVSGHYISFGPTAPIPAKRKVRILEEIDTAEKALQRGR